MIDTIIKTRRSISSFTDQEVSIELIDKIISAASYAPSSCNTQPWYFLVFNSEESKNKINSYIDKGYERTYQSIMEDHKFFGKIYIKLLEFFSHYGKFDNAPILILLFAKPYDTPLFSQAIKTAKNKHIELIAEESVNTSSAMAMQNFLLLAHENGLGTRVKDGIKFLMNFEDCKNDLYKEFQIPNTYKLISGIQLGYPTESALKRVTPKRLPIESVRKFI